MLHAHFKAAKFIEEFPHNTDGRGLMFVGLAGRGKTHLAVGVMRALIEEKKCQGLFCDYAELLKQIQNSYNPRTETTAIKSYSICSQCPGSKVQVTKAFASDHKPSTTR
jgi:DNA replication protein DnaC